MSSYFKRSVSCFVALLLLMTVCGARILSLSTDKRLTEAAASQSTRRLSVATVRGQIYDCLSRPLTGVTSEQVTVIMPTDKGFAAAEKLCKEDADTVLSKLRSGNPQLIKGGSGTPLAGTVCFDVPVRYSGSLQHVIGYTDGTGHGVAGIEKYFDDILFPENDLAVTYTVSSTGRMLSGEGYKIVSGGDTGSVTLTVDMDIQKAAEQAMEQVPAGAAVIVDAKSGAVKAMVSRPSYDQYNVAAALADDKSAPLINRALFAYNVGSVFKPCVAAAAIENGAADYTYTCSGQIEYGGLTFKCNSRAGHGTLDLKGALERSCNTYFYTLALKIGAENVYRYANSFRFGSPLQLDGGIISQSGSMPRKETLEQQSAALINLSIGQGELLLSPVAISCMYAAIVNGGSYYQPYIVEKWESGGSEEYTSKAPPIAAIKKETADTLSEYLAGALQNGTGKGAYVEGIAAGGKTGTAQTGWKDGDRSILNGWFCGYMKGELTDYAIVILKEDVRSGSADCAPVFKEIIEKMHDMGK